MGQRLTLFDFNWGTIAVPYPAPIAAMVAMGSNLVNCISNWAKNVAVSGHSRGRELFDLSADSRLFDARVPRGCVWCQYRARWD